MLLRILRFVILSLAFFFIYRLIVRTYQYLRRDERSQPSQGPHPPPPDSMRDKPVPPADIRDARFRDIPDDSQKPS